MARAVREQRVDRDDGAWNAGDVWPDDRMRTGRTGSIDLRPVRRPTVGRILLSADDDDDERRQSR